MTIEAVLQQIVKIPIEQRAEPLERLIDSLGDDEVELSVEDLAHLDEAISDADRAVECGELTAADDVLAQMRQMSQSSRSMTDPRTQSATNDKPFYRQFQARMRPNQALATKLRPLTISRQCLQEIGIISLGRLQRADARPSC